MSNLKAWAFAFVIPMLFFVPFAVLASFSSQHNGMLVLVIGLITVCTLAALSFVGKRVEQFWRSETAEKLRFRLLAKRWLVDWFPGLWDWLREDERRATCCEISDCWNEPTHMLEGRRVCSKHYVMIAEIDAADQARRAAAKNEHA